MTDLQTILIFCGSAIVAGVYSYNKWHEYKAKKSVERAFSNAHDDVLMTPAAGAAGAEADRLERQEPVLVARGAELPSSPAGDGAANAIDGHASVSVPSHPSEFDPLINAAARELPVDELIDCAIALEMESPVRGEKILPALQTLRHVGNKSIHYIGLRLEGEWEPVTHGNVYTALQAGVQIANRSSALNEIEYSELVMRLRQIADGLGAELDVPDMGEVMSAARALYQFVSEHDAQLGVNIHSNGAPWAINTLLTALERQGFDLRPDGRFVMQDGDGGVLFSLSTNVTLAAETTPRLTLLLDVPCVAPLRDGFGAMVACAKSLVKRLDGTIVDDSNQALSDTALGEISGQVNAFYDDMLAVDIPAGSTRALRLFS
jgi:hypothetical protein